MMKSQKKLVEFLTSQENVSFVVDILKHGNLVREKLMSGFWIDLTQYLQEHAPTVPALPKSMVWQFYPDEANMGDKDAAICLWDETHDEDKDQFLYYGINQDRSGGKFTLDLCLEWEQRDDDLSSKSELHKLKSVAKLRNDTVEGFKKGEGWLLYKAIASSESVDHFLAAIIVPDGRELLLRDVCDSFWPFVEDTIGLVVEANKEVAKLKNTPSPNSSEGEIK